MSEMQSVQKDFEELFTDPIVKPTTQKWRVTVITDGVVQDRTYTTPYGKHGEMLDSLNAQARDWYQPLTDAAREWTVKRQKVMA